jgi:long-chain alkane monooxygenase
MSVQTTHETFEDVVNLLVPELQSRGAYPSEYGPGRTLRERLFGEGPYLPSNHPAAQYRDIEIFKQGEASRLLSVPGPTLAAE